MGEVIVVTSGKGGGRQQPLPCWYGLAMLEKRWF